MTKNSNDVAEQRKRARIERAKAQYQGLLANRSRAESLGQADVVGSPGGDDPEKKRLLEDRPPHWQETVFKKK